MSNFANISGTVHTSAPLSRRRNFKRTRYPLSDNGFTLFELLLAIIIISGLLAIALPRFANVGGVYLKTDAGKVATLVRFLNEASATRKVYYRVWFDMEKDSLRVESSKNGVDYVDEPDAAIRRMRLHDGVAIEDIIVPDLGKVDAGEVAVIFAPAGSIDAFTLHLKSSGRAMTLTFNPYSGEAKVIEGYV